jgi:hypothetical protein
VSIVCMVASFMREASALHANRFFSEERFVGMEYSWKAAGDWATDSWHASLHCRLFLFTRCFAAFAVFVCAVLTSEQVDMCFAIAWLHGYACRLGAPV